MHSMQGYADAWIVCEESCGQCIVCSGIHVGNGQEVWHNYEEGTVSNDDEMTDSGGTREPEGLFSPAGPRVTAYSIETVTRVTSRDIMSR